MLFLHLYTPFIYSIYILFIYLFIYLSGHAHRAKYTEANKFVIWYSRYTLLCCRVDITKMVRENNLDSFSYHLNIITHCSCIAKIKKIALEFISSQ